MSINTKIYLPLQPLLRLLLVGILQMQRMQCSCGNRYTRDRQQVEHKDNLSNSEQPDYMAIANQRIAQMEASQQALFKKMKETAQQEAIAQQQEEEAYKRREEQYRLATEKQATQPNKHFFMPSFSTYDVNEIKEDIQYLQEDLAQVPAGAPLPPEQQAEAQHILTQIAQQQKELKPLYRDLKAIADHRGGDVAIFQTDTSQFDEAARAVFEKEALSVKRSIEHPQLAKNLLAELQRLQEELQTLLEKSNESPSAYGHDAGYASDPENDYTQAQLGEYLNAYLSEAHASPAVRTIKNALSGQLSTIIQKLGAKQEVSAADFAKLLADAPALAQHIRATAKRPDNQPLISNQILQAIVASIAEPYGQSFQLTSMNEIKKRVHKLKMGIHKVVKRELENSPRPSQREEE